MAAGEGDVSSVACEEVSSELDDNELNEISEGARHGS